jgi:moderate conductance mechanosensitive channel
MNFEQLFNASSFKDLWLPVIIGIVIIMILFFLRWYLNKIIHKLASMTTTSFDDILIHEIRIATFLWCIWIGIFSAYKLADTPQDWMKPETQIIPVLFVAIGIYTFIMIIMATLKWYQKEICPRTSSTMDDIIMRTLLFGTPIVGGGLGLILILNMLGYHSDDVNNWLSLHGLKMAILIIIAVTLLLLTTLVIPRVIEKAVRNARGEQAEEEIKKRSDTLIGISVTSLQIVIIFMFVLMILAEIPINITALVTGAGVLGLAVSFGAQSLVKDVLAGLFIIMENQYRKGDVINIAGVSGVVEEINLRRTVLRDTDGVYHVVPNGEIRVSSNLTKLWSRVNLNISVAYDTNLEKAMAVINRVGKEMAEDPIWGPFITNAPRALRIDNLGDSGIEIKVMAETRPSRQWDVAGELRLRIKKAFDKESIDIPYPHTKVILEQASGNRYGKEPENTN